MNALRTKIQLLWDFFIFLQKTLYFITVKQQIMVFTIGILEEALFEIESNFEDYKLLLAGDFNSRTAELEDFVVGDKGNFVPGLQYIINDDRDSKSDIAQCKRNNKDKISNNFGRSLVQLCGTNDMCIINGRKTGDNDGEFTYL